MYGPLWSSLVHYGCLWSLLVPNYPVLSCVALPAELVITIGQYESKQCNFKKKHQWKKRKISCQNLTFLTFWFIPFLHYFVNFSAKFYSNIKFLYIIQQPMEWAVAKCPQLYLRMLQRLRNEPKTIIFFFRGLLVKMVTRGSFGPNWSFF